MVQPLSTVKRLEFHAVLEDVAGPDRKVYFQPPDDVTMTYPCIVYERDNASFKSADNKANYNWTQRYQVTYIARLPDNDVIDKLTDLPLSAYSRHFSTSGLNHDVFVIYH